MLTLERGKHYAKGKDPKDVKLHHSLLSRDMVSASKRKAQRPLEVGENENEG